jgi:hypothetical protein
VKRTLPLLRFSLLPLVVAAVHGCQAADRHKSAVELAALSGISVLEFDGVFLRIKRASSDATGLSLVIGGSTVDEAELRVGDQFLLTDGQAVHQTYQLLLASEERITLRREQVFDRRATREGIRTVQDVIALRPYNLEDTDSPRVPREPR